MPKTIVRIAPPGTPNLTHEYFQTLLEMALRNTVDEFGEFEIHHAATHYLQSEAANYLRRGKEVDVIWVMTSQKQEAQLAPIRIPLFKGLLGYRVPVVQSKNHDIFAHVSGFAELMSFTAGQGIDWPDTEIMAYNGLTVVGISHYADIYTLLVNGKIDYYPRGIIEVWKELESVAPEGVTVDPYILLQYRAPLYFFVHPDNHVLIERLTKGLLLAIERGEFDEWFYAFFRVDDILNRLNIANRKIILIENPQLTPMTPTDEKFWLDPDNYD